MNEDPKIWFNVILRPHRSLSRRGFLLVMSLVALISFTAGPMSFAIAPASSG